MSTAAVSARSGVQWDRIGIKEEVTPAKTGNGYADAKIDAEKQVRRQIKRGLPAVILRPGIVFGPYSFWINNVVNCALTGRVPLVDHGHGICESVYIDNLVAAIIRAIENDSVDGMVFNVSDAEEVLWRDFKVPVAKSVDPRVEFVNIASSELPPESRSENPLTGNLKGIGACLVSPEMRGALNKIPATRSVLRTCLHAFWGLPSERQLKIKRRLGMRLYAVKKNDDPPLLDVDSILRESGRGGLSSDRAKNQLGYRPVSTFQQGLETTISWVKYRERRRR